VEGIGIVAFGLANDGQLEVGDQRVVLRHQRQIDVDALPHAGIGKVLTHALAIGRIGEPPPERGQVVLRPRVLNVR
jgi:selenocysteine-specific translation elongation factor